MEKCAMLRTIKDLNARFLEKTILVNRPREAAEYAFAIALLYAQLDQSAKFREWTQHCLQCLRDGREETLEAVACRHAELGGVLIPELFHEGTARQRFDAAAAQLGCQRFGGKPPAPFAGGQPATA